MTIAEMLLIIKETFLPSLPEKAEAKLLNSIVKPNWIVIEVGARTGGTTRLISSLVKRQGLVVSIEPNEFATKRLSRLAKSLQNVLVVNVAASDKNGISELYMDSIAHVGANLLSQKNSLHSKVTTLQIDEIVRRLHLSAIDLIVIDVEGAEAEVISGCSNVLKTAKFVMVEIHHYVNRNIEQRVVSQLLNARFSGICREIDTEEPLITVDLFGKIDPDNFDA